MEQDDTGKIGNTPTLNQNLIEMSETLIERSKQLNEQNNQLSNLLRDLEKRTINLLKLQQNNRE